MSADTARALDALNAIPPDLPREEWHEVGRAAIAAGLTVDDVDAWSANAPNYKGRRDVEASFKTISPNGGTGPGTLFHRAQEHGWSESRPPRENKPTREHSPRVDVAATWAACAPATPAHPYILSKRGNPAGLRVVPADSPLTIAGQPMAGALVVPAYAPDGTLRTLQFIPPQGKKLNMPGASFADGFFIVGNPDAARALIVEGIGQAWACWAATGCPAVVSFGAGRMAAVAQALRDKFARLVIVPDRGKEPQAAEIARAVGGEWVELPQDMPANYDANDYAREHGGDELAELLEQTKQPEHRYKLLTAAILDALPPISWRIRGVLPAQGIAAIYGPSKSGKSFLAFDAACAIAEGREWFGYRAKPADVVLVCLEGESGYKLRAQAWSAANGRPIPDRLKLVIQPFRLTDPQDVADLAAVVPDGAATIIDTMNRAAPTADENSSRDMGEILEGTKNLQRLTAGLVVLVAHTGKDASRGLRGHSSLIAALDAAIEVSRDGERRTWRVDKQKDGRDGETHAFRLDVHTLGFDEDREPLTSCSITPDNTAPTLRTKPLTANQRQGMESFRQAAKDGSAHLDAWREEFYRISTADTQAAKKKAFQRARTDLVDGGFLTVSDDTYRERDTGQRRDIAGTCPAVHPVEAGQTGQHPVGVSRVPSRAPTWEGGV